MGQTSRMSNITFQVFSLEIKSNFLFVKSSYLSLEMKCPSLKITFHVSIC